MVKMSLEDVKERVVEIIQECAKRNEAKPKLLSFSEQDPIVYKEAPERIKRRRRGTNYSLAFFFYTYA